MRLRNIFLFSVSLLIALTVVSVKINGYAYAESVMINDNENYTNDRNTRLTFDYNDKYDEVRISNVIDFESGANTITWTKAGKKRNNWYLSSGDGMKTVYVQFRNETTGETSNVYNDTITLDTSGPTGSVSINNGQPVTSSTAVNLVIYASDAATQVTSMIVSTNPNFGGSSWEPYTTSKSMVLSGEGIKTVYIKFKDSAGNESSIYSDTITLQTGTVSDFLAPTGSIYINNGAATTNSTNVTLNISGYDSGTGVNSMLISNDPSFSGTDWVSYSAAKSWTLTSGDGIKTVYIKFCDGAGNISSIYNDTITLQQVAQGSDTIAPTGAVIINSGAATTSNPSVALYITGSDAGGSGLSQVRISNSVSFGSSQPEAWQPFSGSLNTSWYLGYGDGLKTVYIQFKDGAGNLSAIYSNNITLQTSASDSIAPTGTFSINNGAPITNSRTVTLNISAVDTGVGVKRMIISNHPLFMGAAWEPYAATKTWTLDSDNGVKTVYIRFMDDSQNQSLIYSDNITLKTQAPDLYASSVRMSINNDQPYTNSRSVTLNLAALYGNSNASKMIISNNSGFWGANWEAFSPTKNWTLDSGNGLKTVYVKFADSKTSHKSLSYADSITYNAIGPYPKKVTTSKGSSKVSISNILISSPLIYGQSYKASGFLVNPTHSALVVKYEVTYVKNGTYIVGESGVIPTSAKGRVYVNLSPINDRSIAQIKVRMYIESASAASIEPNKQSATSSYSTLSEGTIIFTDINPAPYTSAFATVGNPVVFSANFMTVGSGTWTGKYERYIDGELNKSGSFTLSNNSTSWVDTYIPTGYGNIYYKLSIAGKTRTTGTVTVR